MRPESFARSRRDVVENSARQWIARIGTHARAPGIGSCIVALCTTASFATPTNARVSARVSCDRDDLQANLVCPRSSFDVTRYRPEDPRVDLIRRKGYEGSGLFNGNRVLAKPSDLSKLSSALGPGAQLIIRDGTWSNVNVTIRANGTLSQPILIRPQSPGRVHFVGRTRIDVVGSHIIVDGLMIHDGNYATATSVLQVGTSTRPCNSCIALSLSMWSLFAAPGSRLHFLGLRGRDVTVAYSSFGRARSPGHFIYDSYPTEQGLPAQLHLLHNTFFERAAASDENGYELLQLGESTVQAQSMLGRLEDNTFVDSLVPHQDTELVTVKSSDWLIRNNVFKNTIGNLSLRSANRVLVEHNRFSGGGPTSASGVRVQGAGHLIVGNYFEQNANPPPTAFPTSSAYYYSIVVPAGTVEDVADGEAGEPVAKDCLITDNTFADGRYNVHLGSFYPEYPIMPHGVFFFGNWIRTSQPVSMFVLPRGNELLYLCNNVIEGNVLNGARTGLQGFLASEANPQSGTAR